MPPLTVTDDYSVLVNGREVYTTTNVRDAYALVGSIMHTQSIPGRSEVRIMHTSVTGQQNTVSINWTKP